MFCLASSAESAHSDLSIYQWEPPEKAEHFLLLIKRPGQHKSLRAITRDSRLYLPTGTELSIKAIDPRGRTIASPLPSVTVLQEPRDLTPSRNAPVPTPEPAPLPSSEPGLGQARSEAQAAPGPDPQALEPLAEPSTASEPEAAYSWGLSTGFGLGPESIEAQGGASSFESASRVAAGQFDLFGVRQPNELGFASFLGPRLQLRKHVFLLRPPQQPQEDGSDTGNKLSLDRTFAAVNFHHLLLGNAGEQVYFGYGAGYLSVPVMKIAMLENGESEPANQGVAGVMFALGLRSLDFAGWDGQLEAAMIPLTFGKLVTRKWLLELQARNYVFSRYYVYLGAYHSREQTTGKLACSASALLCDPKLKSASVTSLVNLGLGLTF